MGSGASLTLNCVSPAVDGQGGAGNWLTNGNFEKWTLTPNVPDN